MKHQKAALIEAITQEEARLVRLDAECAVILERLGGLRKQLSAFDAEPAPPLELPTTLLSTEKIVLFRSLFSGREDVFPKLRVSRSGDRKGYMPACVNDGDHALCGKRKTPRIKCRSCGHQAYIPVNDEVIRGHLQGKQTIGV